MWLVLALLKVRSTLTAKLQVSVSAAVGPQGATGHWSGPPGPHSAGLNYYSASEHSRHKQIVALRASRASDSTIVLSVAAQGWGMLGIGWHGGSMAPGARGGRPGFPDTSELKRLTPLCSGMPLSYKKH